MYNLKAYSPAKDFVGSADENVTNPQDRLRIQAYDLYENLYLNSTTTLKLVLRGDDQFPILMPSGKKIIEATNRFLGVNVDFLVEADGDQGTRQDLTMWWSDFWKRESFSSKFASNKRWGLVRGDAYFYVYADVTKPAWSRISVAELDPRQVFEIEDGNGKLVGVHIVEKVQDFREPDKPDKQIAKRRTFRKVVDELGVVSITSELKFFTIGKWDDRTTTQAEDLEPVPSEFDEEPFLLSPAIQQLPVYKWRNAPLQHSSWGHSQLSGLETLLYALNQTLSDEDATMVFNGLGMYMTTAGPPRGPDGEVTDWNIGPKQIIEIGQDQRFERVTGVTDISPYQNHMNFIDEKGLSESSGTPEVAIGRVDVAVAESGISLQLQMMPLIAANAEKELEIINVLDHMFYDITTMWLPAYEPESFGNPEVMSQLTVVCLFDDPMPKNRDAQVQEVIQLDTSNLILKSMAVAKLRDLGWEYPTVDPYTGEPLDDNDIADMLMEQVKESASAMDPYASTSMGAEVDEFGNPIDQQQTIDLGYSDA
jgi:hypothetical protein